MDIYNAGNGGSVFGSANGGPIINNGFFPGGVYPSSPGGTVIGSANGGSGNSITRPMPGGVAPSGPPPSGPPPSGAPPQGYMAMDSGGYRPRPGVMTGYDPGFQAPPPSYNMQKIYGNPFAPSQAGSPSNASYRPYMAMENGGYRPGTPPPMMVPMPGPPNQRPMPPNHPPFPPPNLPPQKQPYPPYQNPQMNLY